MDKEKQNIKGVSLVRNSENCLSNQKLVQAQTIQHLKNYQQIKDKKLILDVKQSLQNFQNYQQAKQNTILLNNQQHHVNLMNSTSKNPFKKNKDALRLQAKLLKFQINQEQKIISQQRFDKFVKRIANTDSEDEKIKSPKKQSVYQKNQQLNFKNNNLRRRTEFQKSKQETKDHIISQQRVQSMYFNDVQIEESKRNSSNSDEESESCSGSNSDQSKKSESEDEYSKDAFSIQSYQNKNSQIYNKERGSLQGYFESSNEEAQMQKKKQISNQSDMSENFLRPVKTNSLKKNLKQFLVFEDNQNMSEDKQ